MYHRSLMTMSTIHVRKRAVLVFSGLLLLVILVIYVVVTLTKPLANTCTTDYLNDPSIKHVLKYCNVEGADEENSQEEYGNSSRSCGLAYLKDPLMKESLRLCNSINDPIPGSDGESPGAQYEIISVHAFVRVGSYIPEVRDGIISTMNLPCLLQPANNFPIPRILDYEKHLINQLTDLPESSPIISVLGTGRRHLKCQPGELTPLGVAQMIRLGLYLRKRYTDDWHLLGDDLERELSVKTTRKQKAVESTMALLYGLLSKLEFGKLQIVLAHNSSMCGYESDVETCDCSSIRDSFHRTRRTASHILLDEDSISTIEPWLQQTFGTQTTNLDQLETVESLLLNHVCQRRPFPIGMHGKCVPAELLLKVQSILNDHADRKQVIHSFERTSRLKMHPLIAEVQQRIDDQVNMGLKTRLSLYVGDADTLEPLLITLGLRGLPWPAFASRLVLEAFMDTKEQMEYFRVLYDGKIVTHELSFCATYTKGNGLCPYKLFREFVLELNLGYIGEINYATACK